MAYTFRLGFGLRPGLILMWDLEGALVNSATVPAISQTANLAALQSSRASGCSSRAASASPRSSRTTTVNAPTGAARRWPALGYELIQGWNWSFDIEATVTGARYTTARRNQTWTNWSLVNFAINFYLDDLAQITRSSGLSRSRARACYVL